MSHPTKQNCRGGRPAGSRRPGAVRVTTPRRTRLRVSSDAVVSAYIHDISRAPGAGAARGGAAEHERAAPGHAATRPVEFA
jgi:hypothetical protein